VTVKYLDCTTSTQLPLTVRHYRSQHRRRPCRQLIGSRHPDPARNEPSRVSTSGQPVTCASATATCHPTPDRTSKNATSRLAETSATLATNTNPDDHAAPDRTGALIKTRAQSRPVVPNCGRRRCKLGRVRIRQGKGIRAATALPALLGNRNIRICVCPERRKVARCRRSCWTRCCVDDGGRPFGISLRGAVPNHPLLR
jgi:hypothetical protein